ncbi:hypothetical protein O9K51_06533 [Purpureocillium lavendulum]|uniref:Uncharacterized protein n=1 Tax=Purpureocillium lavendulum TaxID=1247861 RepID=A0AB34FNH9_9HYPO|nr:hypothetical protein O9K51_06533 [Purpureocillium lavendulum]
MDEERMDTKAKMREIGNVHLLKKQKQQQQPRQRQSSKVPSDRLGGGGGMDSRWRSRGRRQGASWTGWDSSRELSVGRSVKARYSGCPGASSLQGSQEWRRWRARAAPQAAARRHSRRTSPDATAQVASIDSIELGTPAEEHAR